VNSTEQKWHKSCRISYSKLSAVRQVKIDGDSVSHQQAGAHAVVAVMRPHRIKWMWLVATDVARTWYVCVCVCLSVSVFVTRMYCAKRMNRSRCRLRRLTLVDPRNHVLDGVKITSGEGAISGLVRPIEQHWESLLRPCVAKGSFNPQ